MSTAKYSDATSTKTRPKSGVLTPPTSESSPETNSRKRKRESVGFSSSNTVEDLLRDSFIITPHRSLVFSKPRTLDPILLLPRSELQLSYLDNGISSSGLPQSRFFESHIKILELEARFGSGPVVLIAQLDDGKSIYAVEREDRGLYVLCKLGSWVDLKALKADAVASRHEHDIKTSTVSGSFMKGFAEPTNIVTPVTSKYHKKQRLAIEAIQTMIKKPQIQTPVLETALSETLPAAHTTVETTASTMQNPADELEGEQKDKPLPTSEIVEPTAAELLDLIRTQYFEVLYMSKASLAYFPKGPLSRARAAFHLDFDSTLNMQDLIGFLESMILTTSIMDKKYKDGVPELVKKMAVEFLSGDEANKSAKKRKSKKMKPGKNGLYPYEDEFIRKWVNVSTRNDDSGMLSDTTIKSCIAELRTRETQLQMIILLEVLALQSLNNAMDKDGDLPSTISKGDLETKKEKRPKGKKSEELVALIDLHLDRLCIWQEASDSSTSQEKSPFDSDPSSGVLDSLSKHEANALRDFCVDVIGPFFTARLPEQCAVINRKLGGPVAKPPSRPKLAKSASISNINSRPGAATKRPVLDKSSKSLQRVLTNERRARSVSRGTPDSAAISLMRSVSMSTASMPRFKREPSDAMSLSSIPALDSQSSRGDALKKRYLQREVDLSVPVITAAELKNKKEAAVAAELQDAIAALKRPNRQLAGKVLAETAEQRAASASRSARKTTKPIRNPLFHGAPGVQIMATPKHNRHKDVTAAPSRSISNNDFTPLKSSQSMVPASSVARIPDSTIRPRSSGGSHAHPSRGATTFNIAETPSRPASRSHLWTDKPQNLDIPSSPTFPRNSNSPKEEFQFAVPDSIIRNPFATGKNVNQRRASVSVVEATPTKPRGRSLGSFAPPGLPSFSQRRDSLVSTSAPNLSKFEAIAVDDTKEKENMTPAAKSITGNSQATEGESIYKTLGWDDDDFDDLA